MAMVDARPLTLRRALERLSGWLAAVAMPRVRDCEDVELRELEGNDWGAEAQPKITEFETEESTKAMTSAEFERIV
jgi:hypothetical protein